MLTVCWINSSAAAFVGPSGVTTSTGLPATPTRFAGRGGASHLIERRHICFHRSLETAVTSIFTEVSKNDAGGHLSLTWAKSQVLLVDTYLTSCHHGCMSTTATHKDSQATTALTVRLPAELADALKNYAFITETSGNEVIKRAIVEYLRAHAQTEMVRAAFEKALEQHAIAFDKLADL
jgi:predicted transcriptional regulator